ncbi:MAG: flagellar hook-length control protein FliK [Rhizobacter sp.]|nr:flagellar hook-length control protein FliK [Rhizobacter sp.]
MIKPLGPPVGQVAPVGPDAGSPRLRNDAGRQLVAVAQAPAQRPELLVGESVTARLVERLPDRQWVAIVKGAPFTLRLPAATPDGVATRQVDGGTQAAAHAPSTSFTRGAALSLRVATLTPRLSFVLTGAMPAPTAGTQASLSDAARYLSALVRAGEAPAVAAKVAAPAPVSLLPEDPSAAASLRAQALAQAVRQSGMFYESHLRAWTDGRLPLERLQDEPQARAGSTLKDAGPDQRTAATAELGRLLQRQLDSLDGRPLALTGLAWPGQLVDWTIERDADPAPQSTADDDAPAWSTQLRLVLPRLGELGASLRVVGSQVQLRFAADSPATAATLAGQRDALAERLRHVGLQLNTWAVEHETIAPKA